MGCPRAASRATDAATPDGLEEERRLFYVAVTRAKNEVALVYPMLARDRYGVDVILEPSRFIAELPDAVYERWTIEKQARRRSEATGQVN
jgi:DNA helicase-2/ATP-dependent DNA helicase PcrA